MNKEAARNMGTEEDVSATVATTLERIPMALLQATAIPLPVVRCADGRTSGVYA